MRIAFISSLVPFKFEFSEKSTFFIASIEDTTQTFLVFQFVREYCHFLSTIRHKPTAPIIIGTLSEVAGVDVSVRTSFRVPEE